MMSALAGYAMSQLEFPGRRLHLWWLILASFMVPIQALIVNHFVLMASSSCSTPGWASSCRN